MLVYGKNPVLEIMKTSPEKIDEVLLQEGGKHRLVEIATLAKSLGIKTRFAQGHEINRKCGSNSHQGVVAIVTKYKYFSLGEIIQKWRNSGQKALFLVLDGINDPHNLGAIARSAEILGGSGIIIPKDRAVGVTPTVYKVSSGAVLHIPIAMVTNIHTTIKKLKEEGLWIVGTSPDADTYIQDLDFIYDVAVVIGSEDKGIREIVRKSCDFLVSIPRRGKISSLNASVACGIVLYEALRQRKKISSKNNNARTFRD